MEKYILSIDQSTAGTKAALVSEKGKIEYTESKPHKQFYPQPGWSEHDPEEIFANVSLLIASMKKKAAGSPIAAISISNQRETVMVWSLDTGKPVHNAIVWQCSRAGAICSQIEKAGYADAVFERSGLRLSPFFSAAKIRWILDNCRLPKGERLAFGTIDSWLVYKLSGGKVHATDYSNASRTQLLNLSEKRWDDELFRIFGIPAEMAPEIKFSDDIFALTSGLSCIEDGIPITGVMGDSHSSLFGHMCFSPGYAKTTYGTGSSIMMNAGKACPKPQGGIVASVAWGMNGGVEYCLEGNVNYSCDIIRWLTYDVELIANSKVSGELALSVPDSGGVYLIPAFAGLGAPWWENDVKASIVGITRATKKAHIVRAAEEAIAFQINDVTELMDRQVEGGLKELRIDGGGSNDRFLAQFQADLLQKPISKSGESELSLLGCALMAGLTVGIFKDKSQLEGFRKGGKNVVINPKMSMTDRDIRVSGWRKAIQNAIAASKL